MSVKKAEADITQESMLQENTIQEMEIQDISIQETEIQETTIQEATIQEATIQESGMLQMRLLDAFAQKLRIFLFLINHQTGLSNVGGIVMRDIFLIRFRKMSLSGFINPI